MNLGFYRGSELPDPNKLLTGVGKRLRHIKITAPQAIEDAIKDNDFNCASVLSGNRNFEGRIHPHVKLSYLASPPLVVAYALAGTVDIDLSKEPLGKSDSGEDVFLKDIGPSQQEVTEIIDKSVTPEIFNKEYAKVFEGDEKWRC